MAESKSADPHANVSASAPASAHVAEARATVLAALTRYFRDLDLAEDACQEASLKALASWPERGLPKDPTAWLIMAGRNAAIDQIRRRSRHQALNGPDLAEHDTADIEETLAADIDMSDMRDDVLRLLFMCCHPQLNTQDQLALALKVIGGFSVPRIARAFVIRPKAMEQRITRAKKKAAGIATQLDTPSLQERAERLDAVCLMIYLMFNEGYSAGGGDTHIQVPLCEEALRLARLLLALFPGQPEVMGLLALFLLQHSRRKARLDRDGLLVQLDDQDRKLWDRQQIAEGRVLIEKALRHGRPGRYQIQAAIAAVHCSADSAADTDWAEIERLYAALEAVQPSPVVTLNRAVAVWKTSGAADALYMLDGLTDPLAGYLHFHATRAALLGEVGRKRDAEAAYDHALTLNPTMAEQAHIAMKIEGLKNA